MSEPATRPAKRLLSPYEQQQLAADTTFLRKQMDNPHVQMKGDVEKALRRTNDHASQYSPPDLTADQRDRAAKEIDRLESEISQGMLSSEEMRRNPRTGTSDSATSRNLAWHRKNSKKVERWRSLQKALYKSMDRHDLAEKLSIERLRPRMSHMPMNDCAIPQARTMLLPSEQYAENFDRIFGPKDEPSPREEFIESLSSDPSDEELERLTAPEA